MLVSLTVQAENDRGPLYMEQALAALHEGNPERLAVSFEYGSEGESVGLYCRFPERLCPLVEGQLYAHYPECRLTRIAENTFTPRRGFCVWSAELRLHPDLFPCKRFGQFEDALNRITADPLTGILAALAPGKHGELSGQVYIVIQPARTHLRRRRERCLRHLARPFFRMHHRTAHIYVSLALSHRRTFRMLGWLLGRLAHEEASPARGDALSISPSRLHEREEDLQAAADKLGKLLFETQIHVVISGPAGRAAQAREKLCEMAAAFGQFSLRLGTFHCSPIRENAPSASHPFLLSTEELATLWHPPTQAVRAPALTSVESRELTPPMTLPTAGKHPGLAVLGTTRFRGECKTFGILPEDRRRHLAIVGKTGMGKTTLLAHLLLSDIRAGRGVGLIDPHGDLCESLLSAVPSHRTNDVILFDAGDREHPLAFNPLSCPSPEQRPLVASGILSSFKKLYGEFWGPRLEHILRNALLALIGEPQASLLSVLRLLADARYRAAVTARASDPVVRAFWQQEFAGWSPKFRAEAIAPIQNKLGHFLSSPLLRNILGQGRNSLDLRQLLDSGRILLANLSKGRLGDDASALLGSFLVTSLQLAAMSRANVREAERLDFFLYVDEFQNFATESFATVLSEARKYRLALTLANQYLAQLDEATAAAVFGNVGTLVCFQVGANDAEVLAEQLGPELAPGELLRLPHYQAYVRLLIDGSPSRPFSMETLPPNHPEDVHRPTAIRRYSRQRYARPLSHVEREIAAVLQR